MQRGALMVLAGSDHGMIVTAGTERAQRLRALEGAPPVAAPKAKRK